MDRLPAPGNRDLDAIYKVDPDLSRGHLRLLEAGELIVIGQRQEVDTARRGASDQVRGRKAPIRNIRVAVQIDAHAGDSKKFSIRPATASG